jgi:diacylglycerol kinase (ATP)
VKVKRNILVVVNPASGKSTYKPKLNYLKTELSHRDIQHTTIFTERNRPSELAQYMKSQHDVDEVFVIGGDGTLNMVVNEIEPGHLPISIISNGTGNDSVKSLHGILDFKKQVDIALHGVIKKFDLGKCNDRYFVNGVGIGFDGEVVKKMVERGEKRGTHLDYLLTVLKILGGFKEKNIYFNLDGVQRQRKVLLMTISNGTTFGGGFIINPYAKANDGMLDICIINEISPLKRFWHVSKLKSGSHYKIKETEFYKASKISIAESSELVAHLDGEYIGNPPFEISIIKKSLLVRVPV